MAIDDIKTEMVLNDLKTNKADLQAHIDGLTQLITDIEAL